MPECWPYEANLLSYLISSGSVSIHQNNVFQVSTNVGNDGNDNWDDFESNNCVYTGWEGQKRKVTAHRCLHQSKESIDRKAINSPRRRQTAVSRCS